MIPAGWKQARLGDHVEIFSGDAPANVTFATERGLPYVKVEDMNACAKYQSESREYVSGVRNPVPSRSVIFPKRGAAIMGNKVRIASTAIAIDTNMMALSPAATLDSEFLYYFLTHTKLFKIADTSTIPQINNKHILPYGFLLPPVAEQIYIAGILSTWDRAIETIEKLIANSQAQRDTLTQQLLTGKMRLKRFTQMELVRHNKLGPVPIDWKIATIEHVALEVSQRNDGKADHPVLSCSKYDGFVRSLDYFKKQVFSADTSKYKIVKRNQFGFPSNHVEEGSIGLQNIVDCGLVSPIYCVFEPRANMHPFFLYKLLKTDRYRQLFASATNASVDRRGSLRWGEFSQLPIAIPTLEEQESIGEAIRAAENHVSALSSDLEKLKREKSALMQQLLTGKRRVKVPTTQEEAA